MKTTRHIDMTGKEVIIAMLISIIVLITTIVIQVNNWVPEFAGIKALQLTYVLIIFILCFASGLATIATLEIFVIGLITQVVAKRKLKKSYAIVETALTETYTPVKLNDMAALRYVVNEVADVADVISEAKMSNGKVAVRLQINIETEIYVDQFTDNFEIRS